MPCCQSQYRTDLNENQLRRRIIAVGAPCLLLAGLALVAQGCHSQTPAERTAAAHRLERMRSSPNFDAQSGTFFNRLPNKDNVGWSESIEFLTGGAEHGEPEESPPIHKRTAAEFEQPPASGLRVTWLGHSTMLLEVDGYRLLLDPIWSKRASPFSFAGPARFHAAPLPKAELRKLEIDAVLISHDHYDHLDEETIRWISETGVRFLVPLGVGGHMANWGVPLDQITELDWWDEIVLRQSKTDSGTGQLRLIATPARHFSGRTLSDRDQTLWSSWSILGSRHRVFFSGDTALFPGFREIGKRFGPFDLSMMEVGAYNQAWRDVHLGPEQAVKAHEMVRGRVLLPIHWGTFNLGLHAWTEPIERTLEAAKDRNVIALTPKPGESIEPASPPAFEQWWPDVPWETAEESPVYSSNLSAEDSVKSEFAEID